MVLDRFETEAERTYVREVMSMIATDPEAVLASAGSLDLVIDGYFARPTFDPAALRALRAVLPLDKANDDDTFELREVDRSTLADLVPSWAGR